MYGEIMREDGLPQSIVPKSMGMGFPYMMTKKGRENALELDRRIARMTENERKRASLARKGFKR